MYVLQTIQPYYLYVLIPHYFTFISETKNIHQIDTGDGSSMILDVNEDMILISSGSFVRPPCLKLSKSITQIEWIPVTIPEFVCPGSTIKEMEFESAHYSKEFGE